MTRRHQSRTLLERLRNMEAHLVHGLLHRFQLAPLLERFPARLVLAAFMFVNGFLTIGLLACVAMVTHTPFVFPSLGPTAFLFFFSPTAAAASPRNALAGHAIGLVCGYGSLWLTGLEHASVATVNDLHWQHVLAAATALSTTGALMILLEVHHPPAGSTTLIVALGIITNPWQLVTIELAVGALTVMAIVINRMAGIDYPLWHKAHGRPSEAPDGKPKS